MSRASATSSTSICRGKPETMSIASAARAEPVRRGSRCRWQVTPNAERCARSSATPGQPSPRMSFRGWSLARAAQGTIVQAAMPAARESTQRAPSSIESPTCARGQRSPVPGSRGWSASPPSARQARHATSWQERKYGRSSWQYIVIPAFAGMTILYPTRLGTAPSSP